MPRRNACARPTPKPWRYDDEIEDTRRVSTEQMSQSLVRRGLASRSILTGYRGNRAGGEV